ncbi:MAG: T9SS type A sorting domain-containing protein [Flavobacteriales bacterium]|nr:T9SS type A sorting domain-containing protein [Flavobacteriales bacterium]
MDTKAFKIGLLLFIIPMALKCQIVGVDWLHTQIQNPSNDWIKFEEILINDSNDIFIIGQFSGTIDFDMGPDSTFLTANAFPGSSTFIMKTDPNGNLIWAKKFDGNNSALPVKSRIGSNGEIYVLGHFNHTMDADPDSGQTILNSNGGAHDIYILKLNHAGNLIWAKSFGGSKADTPTDFCIDNNSNLYVTGSFQGPCDFDPGPGVYYLTAPIQDPNYPKDDIFVSKLDSAGNFQWAYSIGAEYDDIGNAITSDQTGIYVTGEFSRTVDFDPGTGTTIISADSIFSAPYSDIFIQKIDFNGNLVWVHTFGAHLNDIGENIVSDGAGNIYVSGHFNATVDFDPGQNTQILTYDSLRHFLLKLDQQGNFKWVKKTNNISELIYQNDIFCLGNVHYVSNSSDLFIQRLNYAGVSISKDFINVRGQFAYSTAFTVDQHKDILAAGQYLGEVDFDPTFDSLIRFSNTPDAFIGKYSTQIVAKVPEKMLQKHQPYPNPMMNQLSLGLGPGERATVKILDLTGKVVHEQAIGAQILDLNINSGTYILELTINGQRETHTIIKQ